MTRKVVVATVVVVIVMITVGIGSLVATRQRVSRALDDELVRQASVASEQIREDLDRFEIRPGASAREQIARYRIDLNRSLARARDVGGLDVVAASLTIGNRSIPIGGDTAVLDGIPGAVPRGSPTSVESDGDPMRVVVEDVPLAVGTLTVVAGEQADSEIVALFIVPLSVAVGAGAVAAIGFGVWFSRSTTTRLRRLSETAAAVGAGDLDVRAPVAGHDEISDVGHAMNLMARQIRDTRDREQDFLMAIGHDLRTPLTTIRGYAEALADEAVPMDNVRSIGAVLDRQTRTVSRLIDDLMMLARIDAGRFSVRPVPTDMASIVEEVTDGFAPTAAEHDIEVAASVASTDLVLVDPDRTVQILTNLLENAYRYTPVGGRVEVRFEQAGSEYRLIVGNSGPGIPPADIPRIFDRGYAVDRAGAVRGSGSGLGLAIVKELVEAMGGRVRCTSTPGSWTEIVVSLDGADVAVDTM